MLPNLIIIGFPKCGTSSLFRWLADHPQVVGSSVKETHYFVDRGARSFRPEANFRDHGLEGYEKFFPSETNANIVLEATPLYVYENTAFEQLPALRSNPKFIMVLREPADQILSIYNYFRSNFNFLDKDISFAEFLKLTKERSETISNNYLLRDAFTNSDYPTYLQMWSDRVGSDRLMVYIFEDMKVDTRAFMRRLSRQIDIDSAFYETYGFPLENYSYKLRNYRLHQWNIRIRKILPIPHRSRTWRALRSVYRMINTHTRKEPLATGDQDAYLALKEEFAPAYRELTARYGLFSEAGRKLPSPGDLQSTPQ